VNKTVFYAASGIAALLIWYFLIENGIYAISSDETSRTLISYYWLKSGKIESSSWLPLHFIIIGGGFAFLKDLVWLPRIISLFFGLLTITSAVMLANELFEKKEITIYTLLIALFIPQRVILSVVPLPEIIFFFFIITASVFFFKYQKTDRLNFIIYTSIVLTAANALRYEAWIFTACLAVYVLFKFRLKGISLTALLILASFPSFWLMFNFFRFDDIFYFLKEPEKYYILAQEENLKNTIKFNPLSQFIAQGIITLNISGLIAFYLLRKNHSLRIWIMMFFTPLVLFSLVSLTGKSLPAHNFWRTSAVWVMLTIPFTSYVIYKLREITARHPAAVLLLGIFPLQVINANNFYLKNIKNEYCLNENKIEAADRIMDYFRINADPLDRILIEDLSNFEHFDITLASQEPYRFIYSERNELTPIKAYKYTKVNISHFLVKSPQLKEKLKDRRYLMVLEQDGWELYKRLNDISEGL
jgi:hypothetical protein